MAYKIRKSKEFLRTVLAVLNYIENEWGLKSAQKLTITKHNKVYYKIRADKIFILTLFETKTNPKHNKYE